VPAVVPFLRDLGIEDEVRDYSVFKPGATFVLPDGEMSFRFDEVRKGKTTYSYNVPRDRLDASILAAAERAGAHVIERAARVERVGDDGLQLSQESLDAARPFFDDGPPEWVVDATGRARTFARLLDLPSREGDRKDTALFAHTEGTPLIEEGHVHTDLLDHGWSWRIPLPGLVSVGLVIDSDVIRSFGSTPEEQFDNYIAGDTVIGNWGAEPKRISPVLRYNNYQLATLRGVGNGWALVGDAFGFVDPVFSSGLLVGLDAAKALCRAIVAGGGEKKMRAYEAQVLRHLRNWHRVVDHFYDGRLFTLFRVGAEMQQTLIGRVMDVHFRKHLPRVFTGEATTKRYSVGLLNFMCQYGLMQSDPEGLRVR
jgi:flavin-dependent dehydrogenase